MQKIYNKLEGEGSLYLRQHAENPVYWYPWGEEAFKKAKLDNKPIFLSVGYASCHWCHVMARECFENHEASAYLNRYFIAVKVDREERPDIDKIYMDVCQALTGSGGWPLSVFLTPDKTPFFAGTYFPLRPFINILKNINKAWHEESESILQRGRDIIAQTNNDEPQPGDIQFQIAEKAYIALNRYFDDQYGGFSRTPKFPMTNYLLFLLKYYECFKNERVLHMVNVTLEHMEKGGIYDHIGFGFFRYATDRKWRVPHFEKMLNDNAQLMFVYADAYRITKNIRYKDIAHSIGTYLMRRLYRAHGGFYTAEDADSENEEGKFYLFSYNEVANILGDHTDKFCRHYNITPGGNYNGENILYRDERYRSDDTGVQYCLELLFDYREKRVKPAIDNKMLASLNGLAIAAFSRAGRFFGHNEFISAAKDTARFIINNMVLNGELYSVYYESGVKQLAFNNDYAYLIFGLIELYEATLIKEYLDYAILLNNSFFLSHYDIINGGYYFNSHKSETVLFRIKDITDNSTPSANSVQIYNLYRLFSLTGNTKYYDTAEQTLRFFSGKMAANPVGCAFGLIPLLMRHFSSIDIKARSVSKHNLDAVINVVNSLDYPFINLSVDNNAATPEITVCHKGICHPPVYDVYELAELLSDI